MRGVDKRSQQWFQQPRTPLGRIEAWTGLPALHDPSRSVDQALRAGLTGLRLMCNDGTGARVSWRDACEGYSDKAIERAVRTFHDAKLDVTLTTWMRPRLDWMAGVEHIGELAHELDVCAVEGDFEEPWVQALRALGVVAGAAAWTQRAHAALRRRYQGPMGSTFIVYGDMEILLHAVGASDFVTPQTYATRRNTAMSAPGSLERMGRLRYGDLGAELHLGVAGWNQEGAYRGLTYLEAFDVSLRTAREIGVPCICVWRLEELDAHEAARLRREHV